MLKNINFAKSLLVGNILTGGVALEVTENEGALFPATGDFRCVIWGAAYNSPLLDTTREIITMTLTSGDTFAITRAREGTDAKGWSTNDHIGLVLTAGKLDELEDYVQSGLLSYEAATGTNIYAVVLDPALSAYANGVTIHVKFVDANTGTSTLNVNGLGAKKIYKIGEADYEVLISGDIFDGMHVNLVYETSLDSGGGGWIIFKLPSFASNGEALTGTESAKVLSPSSLKYVRDNDFITNRKIWIYENGPPSGWNIVASTTDALLACKGGSNAYNTAGGQQIGTWIQPNHIHTGSSHTHTYSGNSGGGVFNGGAPDNGMGGQGTGDHLHPVSGTTVAGGTGATGNSATVATYRPLANLGIIIEKT